MYDGALCGMVHASVLYLLVRPMWFWILLLFSFIGLLVSSTVVLTGRYKLNAGRWSRNRARTTHQAALTSQSPPTVHSPLGPPCSSRPISNQTNWIALRACKLSVRTTVVLDMGSGQASASWPCCSEPLSTLSELPLAGNSNSNRSAWRDWRVLSTFNFQSGYY